MRPDRTHNLEELLADARSIGVALPDLDADCALLTPYAIKARYGPHERFDEALGRSAVAAAERIATAVATALL